MFEGVWCELKAKKCFQRQSFTGYSGLALVFVWGGALRVGGGGFISIFRGFFASVGGVFVLAGGLGAGLSFYGVWILS